MSITPRGMAESLRKATNRRQTCETCPETHVENGEASFFVYDNDGGILKVTVIQYKEPIR